MDNRVITLDTTKLDKVTAATMVKDVTFNEKNGIFTVKYLNGATYALDTKLEKLAINWSYDKELQQLIITLEDGTKQTVDLSALITQYEFVDTDIIAFTINSNGKVSATIKDSSITENKLQPNFLAEIKVEAANAAQSASSSATSASNAATSEANAENYYEQTKQISQSVTQKDSAENTVTFTSGDAESPAGWENVSLMKSGEKHSGLFGKISTMFKNIRWLYKMLGTTDISSIGNGTVTGAVSELNNAFGKTFRPMGSYTGNIDELLEKSAGCYWINSSNASGTQPFSNGAYYMLEVIQSSDAGIVQIAYSYSICKMKIRMYMNKQWYDWSEYYTAATIDSRLKVDILTHDAISLNDAGGNYTITLPNTENYDFLYIRGQVRQPSIIIRTKLYYTYSAFSYVEPDNWIKSGLVTLKSATSLQVELTHNAWGSNSPFSIPANSILGIRLSA